MRLTHSRVCLLSLVVLLLAAAAACAPVAPPSAPAAPAAAPAKVLTYLLAQEPNSMDPHVVTESQSGLPIRNVYDRLVELAPDGQTILPGLAETWERSADGAVYTFHLRKDVKFHSGTPFTAEAVRFSLERALTLGKGESFSMKDYIDPAKVKVVDDNTVEITLNKPYNPILSILALHNIGAIVNPELVKANSTADDPWAELYLTNHMDGTGPFKFVEWQPKQFVAIERNDAYWKGPAKLDRVIFRLIEEPATERLMIEKGDADIIHTLPTDMIEALRQNPDVVIASKTGIETTYWAFNNQTKPFTDPRVRQALSYAVDYDAIMTGIVKGSGVQMKGPLPQGLAGFNDGVTVYKRDVAKAKALLAEAGYPDGFNLVTHYPVWRDLADIAVVLQASFAEVGVKLELKEVPLGTLVDLVAAGETPFFPWVSTPNYADPDAVLYPKFHTNAIPFGAAGNIARYSSPEVDKMLDEASSTPDDARRLDLYKQIQAKVTDEAAWVFLFQGVTEQPVRKWVQGYDVALIGVPDFWAVDIVK
jgi:peptide/nickel transport system substrate-binding protein